MAIANFIPELWSTLLLEAYRNEHKFKALVNRNWEGEIRNAGDTVHITTPSAINVGAYAGAVVYQAPLSTQQTLLIDQDVYWAFSLDDADQAQANVSLMQAYMKEAAAALAQNVDVNLASLWNQAGLGPINLQVGVDDPYEDMILPAAQLMNEANVPQEGRWIVVTPAMFSALLMDERFIHATALGDTTVRQGQLGMAGGIAIHMSNNLQISAGTTFESLFGVNAAITLAEQLIKTEALRLPGAFEDAVRGRLVFGRTVVRPGALGRVSAVH